MVADRDELAPLYARGGGGRRRAARQRRAGRVERLAERAGGAARVRRDQRPREASIFACLADTVVAPEPLLPPVRDTDAAAFLDRWLEAAPRLNRIGLRALLHARSSAPRALGARAQAAPAPGGRARARARGARAPRQPTRAGAAAAREADRLPGYYGDDAVMLRAGLRRRREPARARSASWRRRPSATAPTRRHRSCDARARSARREHRGRARPRRRLRDRHRRGRRARRQGARRGRHARRDARGGRVAARPTTSPRGRAR